MDCLRKLNHNMEVMKALLADCGMIGLLPAGIAAKYASMLCILDFTIDFPPAPLMLIQRRGEPRLPSVERFCSTLLDIAQKA